jgi:hypothetical protein
MAIQTRIKPSYTLRIVIIAVVCIGFGLWGAYDFFVRYPADNAHFAEYKRHEEIRTSLDEKLSQGQRLTEEEVAQYDAAKAFFDTHKEQPTEHSQLNIWFQWVYISCLPFGLWMLWSHTRMMKKSYRLEDDGTFHWPGGSLAAGEIGDIDMSRWMAKSIAHVVATDGRRIKLDDYIHQSTHLIVGSLAVSRYPEQWDAQAKLVKPAEDEAAGEGGEEKTDSDIAAAG